MQSFTSAANQTENLKVEILSYFFKNSTNWNSWRIKTLKQ